MPFVSLFGLVGTYIIFICVSIIIFFVLTGIHPAAIVAFFLRKLKTYSEKLSKRTQIIVANKADLMQDETPYKELEKVAKENNLAIFKISEAILTSLA